MQKYYIDVGANNGDDTQNMVVNQNDCLTLAFEPNTILQKHLIERFRGQRVWVFPYAVSDYDGEADFHISELGDAGTSSLHEFDAKLLGTPLKQYEWYEKGFQRSEKVTVRTLASVLEDITNVDNDGPRVKATDFSIEYLHIDAQGSDFAVLRGLGEYIKHVKEGRCEATYKIPIYEGNNNRYEDIEKFLTDAGFEVTRDYIHQHDSEVDLRFRRR